MNEQQATEHLDQFLKENTSFKPTESFQLSKPYAVESQGEKFYYIFWCDPDGRSARGGFTYYVMPDGKVLVTQAVKPEAEIVQLWQEGKDLHFSDGDEVRKYLESKIRQDDTSPPPSGVAIETFLRIDGRSFWKYSYEGAPTPRMRYEQWIRDDGKQYDIINCLNHTIEQVVRGEVTSPFHDGTND